VIYKSTLVTENRLGVVYWFGIRTVHRTVETVVWCQLHWCIMGSIWDLVHKKRTGQSLNIFSLYQTWQS